MISLFVFGNAVLLKKKRSVRCLKNRNYSVRGLAETTPPSFHASKAGKEVDFVRDRVALLALLSVPVLVAKLGGPAIPPLPLPVPLPGAIAVPIPGVLAPPTESALVAAM